MTQTALQDIYLPIISDKEIIYFDAKKADIVAVENETYFFVNPKYLDAGKMDILEKNICDECELYFNRKLAELMEYLPHLFF
jgi:hypothetical protein